MYRMLVPCFAIFSVLVVSTDKAKSENLLIRPHLDTGVMQYKYDQEDQFVIDLNQGLTGITTGWQVEDLVPFVGGGLTVAYGKFFADLYGQMTAEGKDTDTQTQIVTGSAAGFAELYNFN
jgi:hypothetical protein